jgi:hypothetical protein
MLNAAKGAFGESLLGEMQVFLLPGRKYLMWGIFFKVEEIYEDKFLQLIAWGVEYWALALGLVPVGFLKYISKLSIIWFLVLSKVSKHEPSRVRYSTPITVGHP